MPRRGGSRRFLQRNLFQVFSAWKWVSCYFFLLRCLFHSIIHTRVAPCPISLTHILWYEVFTLEKGKRIMYVCIASPSFHNMVVLKLLNQQSGSNSVYTLHSVINIVCIVWKQYMTYFPKKSEKRCYLSLFKYIVLLNFTLDIFFNKTQNKHKFLCRSFVINCRN